MLFRRLLFFAAAWSAAIPTLGQQPRSLPGLSGGTPAAANTEHASDGGMKWRSPGTVTRA